MSRYAVGVRVHSGWAAAAVATGTLQTPLILQRGSLTNSETHAGAALASFLSEGSADVSLCAILTSNDRTASDRVLSEAIARAAVHFGLDVVPIHEDEAAQNLAGLRLELGPPWGSDEKLASIAALLGLEQGALAAV